MLIASILSDIMLIVIMPSVILLCRYSNWHYDECHFTECHMVESRNAEWQYIESHYGECHYAERRNADCHYSDDIMISVIYRVSYGWKS